MSRYNPFPVAGQFKDGDKIYLGVHEMKDSSPVANSFRYVTYQTNNQEIYAHSATIDSTTGELVFGSNIKLIVWTYKKYANSTAVFSTDITGNKQYLYTEKNGLLFPPSSLGSSYVQYQTQGLPDLWAGYFGYFITAKDQNSTVKINMDNPSNFVVAIPTTLYDKENACMSIDNTSGQGLAPAINDYINNINSKIYWCSSDSCKSTIPVTYCQNQNVIVSSGNFDQNSRTDPIFCGQSIGTDSKGAGTDISNSCMAVCSNFSKNKNNPVCYPGTIDSNVFGCTNYNAKRSIYSGDGGGGGDNGGGGGKPLYKQNWFIFMMIAISILVILIVIVIVFRSRK